MKNNLSILAYFLIALLIVAFAFITCGDDDDDNDDNGSDDEQNDDDDETGDDDDSSTSPECSNWESNHGPELLCLVVIVNGLEVEQPATILANDTLELAIEYSDEDCNLQNGFALILPDTTEPDYGSFVEQVDLSFPLAGIGCSSSEEGEPYIIQPDPVDLLLPEGMVRTKPWLLYLMDDCTEYVTLPFDITVVEPAS